MANQVDETVSGLLQRRWDTLCRKNTPFGSYLQIQIELFEENTGLKFNRREMISTVEKDWIKLSLDYRNYYRRVNVQENSKIDEEVKRLDEMIIAARPGQRIYAGLPVKAATKEKDKLFSRKLGLCPTFWSMMEDLIINVGIVLESPWRQDDVKQLIRDSIKKWPSLPQHLRDSCVERAKFEYFLITGSHEGDNIVEDMLKEKLKKPPPQLRVVFQKDS